MNTACEIVTPACTLRSESETKAALLAATGGRETFGFGTHHHIAARSVLRQERAQLATLSAQREDRAAALAAGCVASLDSGCRALGSLPCEPSTAVEGPLDPFSSDFWAELLATTQECTADLIVRD